MSNKTLGQIEYEKRMADRIVNCEKCDKKTPRTDAQRMFTITDGRMVYLYGNHDQMPGGWYGYTCQCGTIVPTIEYDKFDHEKGKQYAE
jgi:hypothetical protein